MRDGAAGSLVPYVGTEHAQVRSDGFHEQGAAGFGLRSEANTAARTQAIAGLRVSRDWQRFSLSGYAEWQQTLETAVSNGFAKEADYSATSKSGIGYTLRAGADFKVNKQMTLGGQIGYDTLGVYNDSTAGLYIRYMLGDH